MSKKVLKIEDNVVYVDFSKAENEDDEDIENLIRQEKRSDQIIIAMITIIICFVATLAFFAFIQHLNSL